MTRHSFRCGRSFGRGITYTILPNHVLCVEKHGLCENATRFFYLPEYNPVSEKNPVPNRFADGVGFTCFETAMLLPLTASLLHSFLSAEWLYASVCAAVFAAVVLIVEFGPVRKRIGFHRFNNFYSNAKLDLAFNSKCSAEAQLFCMRLTREIASCFKMPVDKKQSLHETKTAIIELKNDKILTEPEAETLASRYSILLEDINSDEAATGADK